MLVATDAQGRLRLPQPEGAGVRSDRSRRRRPPAPAGLDAFVYTERGVYRSGETVHVTALLRDAQGVAALNVPLTLVVERPDGVEYRRVVRARSGRRRPLARACRSIRPASTGTWRVRAFTDPKRPAVGETTFLVEDYVPDRLEFDLAAPPARSCRATAPAEVTRRWPLSLWRAGVRPRSRRRGDRSRRPRSGRALPAISFGLADEEVDADRAGRSKTCRQTDDKGKATLRRSRSTSCRRRRVRSKRR